MNFPRVRCAICNAPVERLELWQSPEGRANVLKVFCHGDTDSMEFRAEDLFVRDLERQIMSQEGVAFTRKRLDAAPQHA